MTHKVWRQIAYFSGAFELETDGPIETGTPDGAGFAIKPQVSLNGGDLIRGGVYRNGQIESRVAKA